MTMRIGYMTGEYPRSSDTFIQREVAAVREHGVEVETISIRKTPVSEHVGPEQRDEAGRTHYVLPCSPLMLALAHIGCFVRSPARWFRAFRLAWKTREHGIKGTLRQMAYFLEAAIVARIVRKKRIEHLHNHFANSSCSVAMLAAEMGAFTFSFTLHGPAIFFETARWRLDEKIRRASFVACISHFCRSQAMIWADPSEWDKLRIVHCGVIPENYTPRLHDEVGRRLLFVGRLAPVKGLNVLLDAFAQVQETHSVSELVIIGDGPQREDLQQRVRRDGLDSAVRFAGKLSQTEVADLLNQSDLFVLPSFAEGVPVVLMEAMAAGLPVVTTNIAGVSELVTHGESGLLLAPGDVDALVNGIRQLLDDAELRNTYGAAGREQVRREFEITGQARKLVDLFHSLTGASAAPPTGKPRERAEPAPVEASPPVAARTSTEAGP